jgi:hypothetical protein
MLFNLVCSKRAWFYKAVGDIMTGHSDAYDAYEHRPCWATQLLHARYRIIPIWPIIHHWPSMLNMRGPFSLDFGGWKSSGDGVIFVPDRTHIRSRSPRWTASSHIIVSKDSSSSTHTCVEDEESSETILDIGIGCAGSAACPYSCSTSTIS